MQVSFLFRWTRGCCPSAAGSRARSSASPTTSCQTCVWRWAFRRTGRGAARSRQPCARQSFHCDLTRRQLAGRALQWAAWRTYVFWRVFFAGLLVSLVGDAVLVLDIFFLCIISCCQLLCLNTCPCYTHMLSLVHLQLSKTSPLASNNPTPATRTVLEVAALPLPTQSYPCSHCQCNIMDGSQRGAMAAKWAVFKLKIQISLHFALICNALLSLTLALRTGPLLLPQLAQARRFRCCPGGRQRRRLQRLRPSWHAPAPARDGASARSAAWSPGARHASCPAALWFHSTGVRR